MHPHTATSAILRRGLTIRDLQCPPADADTVTSITIDDTIRAAKGNFGFVYAATGDRELYRECLLAESYAKTQYVSCAIHLRRAFELLAFYTVGRALCTVTPGRGQGPRQAVLRERPPLLQPQIAALPRAGGAGVHRRRLQ